MNDSLSLKSISLRFIDRIANPSFENKAIGGFLLSGFGFLYFSQPLSVSGKIQLDFGFFKADLAAGNDPNWYIFLLGVIFIVYGGYALYRLKLSPPVSRRSEICELLLMIEQKKPRLNNVQIQQSFQDLFKIKAPVPVIEKLLSTDDPTGFIYDYRFAARLVSLKNNKFVSAENPPINHQRKVFLYSKTYYVVSFIALICMAAPLAPYLDASTKQQLSIVGFPVACVLGLVAALILGPIRAHSAALRLLASPAGDSLEAQKDKEILSKILGEIYTPAFDNFIYYGRSHIIYDNILHFWEGFNGIVISSSFHIYDERLRELILRLHAAWKKSLSFSQYFVQTNDGHFHKFNNLLNIYRDQDAKAAHDEFLVAINQADQYLRELLAKIREKFPDFDIESTNSVALADFRSYQIDEIFN